MFKQMPLIRHGARWLQECQRGECAGRLHRLARDAAATGVGYNVIKLYLFAVVTRFCSDWCADDCMLMRFWHLHRVHQINSCKRNLDRPI